jgi:hypothetical protein
LDTIRIIKVFSNLKEINFLKFIPIKQLLIKLYRKGMHKQNKRVSHLIKIKMKAKINKTQFMKILLISQEKLKQHERLKLITS